MKTQALLYYLLIILASIWCIGIIAAPILKHAGWTQSADTLYSFFSHTCHQDDARSFHILGEKVSVCIRCSAIYFGFLFGLIAFPLTRLLKLKNLPARVTFLLAIFPMLLDVGCNFADIHASTPITRIITGGLFGISIVWLIIPIFIEACMQILSRNKKHSLDHGAV
ncbi:MAG: DUF2085 domain-containing protein [Bacteroidetes bacterium]|nr:DUF2085 domain-containing protein [Bacteroidota bacterium]